MSEPILNSHDMAGWWMARLILPLIAMTVSCSKVASIDSKFGVITGDATAVAFNRAVISGKVNLPSAISADLSFGVLYSTSPGVIVGTATQIIAESYDSEFNFSVTIDNLEPETTYYYRSYIINDAEMSYGELKSLMTLEEGAVDLGLSVKWRNRNLDASNPEDYGGHYQWAGLEDVTSTSNKLDWSDCPYHTGSSCSTGWTKYNTNPSYGTVDDKTVLDPEDDVAHVKLGGNWRMPTEAEFNELKYNCTSEWTTLNGINGIIFISRKNGNSIFLPEAGFRDNRDLFNTNSAGYYWSSSHFSDIPFQAYYFSVNNLGSYPSLRWIGRSVRPVSE